VAVGAGVVTGGVVVGVAFAMIDLPAESGLEQATYVCDASVDPATTACGPTNAMAVLSAGVDRQVITTAEVPAVLRSAVIAAEDRSFDRHSGLDPIGIVRAFVRNLRSGGVGEGGSTITQQYVKNTFLTQERTYRRKVVEAVLAVKVERRYSKDEILTRYLNTIYLGRGTYGVAAGSSEYFGVDVTALGEAAADPVSRPLALARTAYLVGLIRSPETADASLDPAEATLRRDLVLDAMVQTEVITAADRAAAAALPIEAIVRPRSGERTGMGFVRDAGSEYVVDWVRGWLSSSEGLGLDPDEVYTGGLQVFTTIDPVAQRAAFAAAAGPDGVLPDRADPSAALVAVDEEGRVRALVGGRDFAESQVNLALGVDGGGSGRQPGSTFKTFALAAALEAGWSPLSTFPAPSTMTFAGLDGGADWKVSGGASPTGRWTLLDALAVSSNTVYAQLMVQLGAADVVELAGALGVGADLPVAPSLVLGSGEVSVLDMADAYATFARRGERVAPSVVAKVVDGSGRTRFRAAPVRERVVEASTADAVTVALRAVVDRGTGAAAALDRDAVGKTGTTEDYRDAWFVGSTCTGATSTLTAAVWTGYAGLPGQPTGSMRNVRGVATVTGGTFPAEIWGRFMAAVVADRPACSLAAPSRLPGEVRTVASVRGATIPPGALASTTTVPVPTSTTVGGGSGSTSTTSGAATTVPGPTSTTGAGPTSSGG
jgi:membrane peptidoglycan carboxypeptidase